MLIEQVRRSAQSVDESRVQRSFRSWVNWLIARGRSTPVCIVLVPGSRAKKFARELKLEPGLIEEAAFELGNAEASLRADRPWPRLVCPAVPGDLTLLIVNDPEAFSTEWDAVAVMRRECAIAIVFSDDEAGLPQGLFDRLPVGLVRVSDKAGAEPGPGNPVLRHYAISVPAGTGPAGLLTRIFPEGTRGAVRAAIQAKDLADIARALQAEEESSSAAAGILAAAEGARTRRNEADRLASELELLAAARNDLASEMKAILNSLRQERSEIETGSLVEQSTTAAFESLVQRFDPSSDETLDNLIQTRPKRTWWEGTRFRLLSWFFSKKSEAQLDSRVLNESLTEVEHTSLRWLGKITAEHVSEFNRAVESVGLSYFSDKSPLTPHVVEKVHRDNFVIGAKPPPGGAAPSSDLAQKMVLAAQTAFKSFAANEVRAFRIDRERRGFIGQITEARSAIFGIYFLLLMGVRMVPPMECVKSGVDTFANDFACWSNRSLNYDLRVTLMALIVIGLLVNIFSHPRQERAMLADRVQGKLEELRNRLTAFLDRFLKDQLTLLETTLTDQAAIMDATLERMRTAAQAKLDAIRTATNTARPERPASVRPVQLDDLAAKLLVKVQTDFQAEYTKALAAE